MNRSYALIAPIVLSLGLSGIVPVFAQAPQSAPMSITCPDGWRKVMEVWVGPPRRVEERCEPPAGGAAPPSTPAPAPEPEVSDPDTSQGGGDSPTTPGGSGLSGGESGSGDSGSTEGVPSPEQETESPSGGAPASPAQPPPIVFLPVEGGPVVSGGRGNARPSGDAIGCPEGSAASLEVDARTGEWRMWCTRRVVQEVAVPESATNPEETDPIPGVQAGQGIPGTRVSSQGSQRPAMSCPTGSAPSVVGNDSFRGILVWECVKTWQQYQPPTPVDSPEGDTESGTLEPSETEIAEALAESTVSVNRLTGEQIELTPEQQSKRVDASVGVVGALSSRDISSAANSATLLSEVHQEVAVSSLSRSQQRSVTKDLRSEVINSPLERQVREEVNSLVANDLSVVLKVANVERPEAVSTALADSRVQGLLASDTDPEVTRQARLALTAGNLPAVAGILRTQERVPRTEYRIAEALSKGQIVEARRLASQVNRFESSVVSLALQELLISQGQSSASAQTAAARALADGKLRSGAWYAFQGSGPQACTSVGCAWLGSAASR